MNIIRYLLIVVEIVSCLMLIGVILLQQSKSQGMGVAFGGGMSETIFGSRAGNILTKTTITLAIIFLVNTTLLGILYTSRQEESLVDTAVMPAAAPVASGPITGGEQVPPPTQRGTLFTPEDAAVPAAPVEPAAPQTPVDTEVVPADLPVEPVAP